MSYCIREGDKERVVRNLKSLIKITMSLFKKILDNSGKANQKSISKESFEEGDIFYTFSKRKYHLYKLLKVDIVLDAYHVLFYTPVDKLPNKDSIKDLGIQIYHMPINRNGFNDPKLLLKHSIKAADLIGYHAYLRQTRNFEMIKEKSRRYYEKAYGLDIENKHEQAIDEYSKACNLTPQLYEAFYQRAYCKIRLGRWSEAVKDLQQSLAVNPDNLPAEFTLGECYYRLRVYTKAKEHFQKAVAIDPKHVPSSNFLIAVVTEMANSSK